MVDRIRFLTSIFALDVAAYAVMSNHYHLVVHVNVEEAKAWSLTEVCERWVNASSNTEHISEAETETAIEMIEVRRERLTDVPLLMRSLNEHIAGKANREDNCKGRFWEGRFKSQALLDEKTVIACMAYVDLNPIRAKMENSLKTSEYTSVFERIHDKSSKNHNPEHLSFTPKPLLGFIGNEHKHQTCGVAFSLLDYLNLVEAAGKIISGDKRGAIDENQYPLLQQLGMSGEDWLHLAQHFGKEYHQAVGSLAGLEKYAQHLGKRWISTQRQQALIFH